MKPDKEWRDFRRRFFREHQRLSKLVASAERQFARRGRISYQTVDALNWVDFRLKALEFRLNSMEGK